MIRRPPRSPLFPSTPLFRSLLLVQLAGGDAAGHGPPDCAPCALEPLLIWLYDAHAEAGASRDLGDARAHEPAAHDPNALGRSEEHTSELQSRQYLVCRLLLEKKTAHSSST